MNTEKEFVHSEENIKIDRLLKFISEKGSYDVNIEDYNKNKVSLHIMSRNYNLITCRLNRNYYITDTGSIIINNGGWLKHIEKKNQKEIYDFKASKWKYYTFWIWFTLGIFGGCYSAYDFIERLSKEENSQSKQTTTEVLELGESKLHTLTSVQKKTNFFMSSSVQ